MLSSRVGWMAKTVSIRVSAKTLESHQLHRPGWPSSFMTPTMAPRPLLSLDRGEIAGGPAAGVATHLVVELHDRGGVDPRIIDGEEKIGTAHF